MKQIEIVVNRLGISGNMEGENTMEKRLRVFRAHWRIFLWRSEVIELLKSLLAGISNGTFTCKSRTFLLMFECFWEYNTKIITGLIVDLY